jgi:uncharacterized repeat protein (TIGR01451 family)
VTPQFADLALSKNVNDPTPNFGDTVTFTISLTNNGPDAATNVQVSDLLPVGLTFVAATPSQGTYSSATGLWAVGTVAATAVPTLQIEAVVDDPDPLTNIATISHSDQFDPDTGNNSADATVTPQRADLALTKTVNNPTPNVGDTVTFTIGLTNKGPDTATNVNVADVLPPGLSLVSATPSQGTYGGGVWTVGTVSPSVPLTLVLTATVVSPNPETNTATISHADQFDPNTANNSASAKVTPQQADLAVLKTVSNSTPNVSDTVTFTITLRNRGPNAASGVQLTDSLPVGLTFVAALPSQGSYNNATGIWTVGTVATTNAVTLRIRATVVSPDAETNTATITASDQFDPNTGNNTSEVTVTPQQADLAVTKSVDDSTPNVGDTVTFTVHLTNNGPNTATNVKVADALPAGLTLISATPSQGTFVAGVWTVGTVAASATKTLTITAHVVSPNAATNTATISHADQFDPDTSNNQAGATVTPQQADLVVGKSVSDPTPNVGDTITYTITVTNDGPNDATNVIVRDIVPPQVRVRSSSRTEGSYDPATGIWTVGTIPAGATETLIITVVVTSPNPKANTATITHSDQFDPNTSNNSATASINPQQADLQLTKIVNDATPNVGDTVTFTIGLRNNGPSSATGVQVTDLLPVGLTFVAATPSQGSYTSATGVWDVGSVAANAMPTLQIQATVVSPGAETNTAVISAADQFDPDPNNNQAASTVTPQKADLALTKTVNDETPNVGDTVTFTVSLVNHGPDDATNVTVADALPAGLTLVTATPSQGTYGGGVWTVGTVSPLATPTLIISALVVSPNSEMNTATISHSDQFDANTGNNTAAVTVTPQQADLMLSKSVNDPTPNVGQTVTFTLSLTNRGPDTATGVQVSDLLPAGLTFVAATPSQGSYNSTTGVWSVGSVTTTATPTLLIHALVISANAVTNTATVSHADQFDPNTANNTSDATVTPQQADLALTKTVDDATPNVGDTVTFTVSLTNSGPDAATNVTVADALPAGLMLVTATPSQGTYTGGIWTVGTVSTSSTPTLVITAHVVSPSAATNTATITHADQFDPDTGNNSASTTVTPQHADLALSKTVNDPTPNVGETVTFTIGLINNGPDTATNVSVADALPAGLTLVSAMPSQGSYAGGVWTVGTVAPFATPTLVIAALVVSPNAETNTATISHSDQFDPNTSNNSSGATVTPQHADLALTKTVNDPTPNVGDTVNFTITLTNKGPDAATNVSVADALPAGLTLVNATPSQGTYAGGVWTVGTVNPLATQTLVISALVVTAGAKTNTADISHADQFDPNTGNNSGSVTITPQQADLALSKTVNKPAPNVGDTVTFTIGLTNKGPDAATNVTVADALPAGLTLVSATPSQGTYTGGVWTVGTVNPLATPTLVITALVVSPDAETNTATISHADQFDPDTSNDTASVTVTPQQADLALTKTVNDPTPNVGQTVTFTITLTNNGPDAATNVSVADALPPGLTLVSALPSQGTYASGVWTVGTVNPLAAPTLVISAVVNSPNPQINTATISHSDQFDPDTVNNTASATVSSQQADLVVGKQVSNPTPNVGDTITYTITVTNDGPDTATGVVLQDTLPPQVRAQLSNPTEGSYDPATGIWTVGTIPVGVTETLIITVLVVSPNPQANTSSITHADQFDPNTANNSVTASTNPLAADLELTKVVNDPTPNVGDTVTFTISLINNGPSNATGVQVTDLLPAGLTFVAATPSTGTTYDNGTGVWDIGSVASTATVTLQIQATVTSPNAATNTAMITAADQFDPDPGNNSASSTVTPQQADLVMSKSVNDPTPNVGDTVTFTISLANHGPDTATNVTVADTLPSGLSLVSATPSQGTYVGGVWTVGTVTTSAAATLTITATVVSPDAETNTATISHSDQFDPNTANNSASATVTPQQADQALTKSVNDPTPNVGDTVTFTIGLTNNGPDAATNVSIADALPAGLTLINATPSQGTFAGGVWTVGTVNALATETLIITARVVSPDAETNTATISHADQFDPITNNNSASTTVTPQQADLALAKSVSDSTPNVGDTVTFTITLSNAGPDEATNVQVSDLLPLGLAFVAATPSQGSYSNVTGVWSVGTVTTTETLLIQATVMSPNAATNTATISHADQFDPNTNNNSATATVTPQQADLALTKSVDDPTPNVGDTITFTIDLTNNGPDAATNVEVSDLLPAGLAFVAATPSPGTTYNNVTGVWDVGSVASTATVTLQIQATVVSPNAETNTATITAADQFDPNTGNNKAEVTVTPQQADLDLSKTVNDPTPNVGDTVTFTITLTNKGPDAATNVTVADTLPTGLNLVIATPSEGSYVGGVWTVGTVNPLAAPTLVITATVGSPNAATNTASITHSDQFDPNTANNSAEATVTPQQADLAIAKAVSDATPDVGDTITFTITLRNNGPDTATNVTVADALPAGLTLLRALPSQGTYVGGVWTVGTVGISLAPTLTITALVASPDPETNVATISHSDQFDPDTTNNSASATETPNQADLALTKTVSNPTPNVGDTVTFTVTLTNFGPNSAHGVIVADSLPAGLTLVTATPSEGSYVGGVWTVGTVSPSEAETLIITAHVTSPTAQTNTATITESTTFDPNMTNDTASVTVTPQQADLALTKTVDNTKPNPGDTVTFTITLTNNGPDPATHVTVKDALPAGLTLVSAAPSLGTYAAGIWTVGTVDPRALLTLTLTARVVSGNPQTNTALIGHSDQFDPDANNNQASATVTPPHANLALFKSASQTQVTIGMNVTYTFIIRNLGPADATGVVVRDPFPPGLVFVSAAVPTQGTYDPVTGTWNVGTLANGAFAVLRVTARVATAGPLVNTARASALQFDPVLVNNVSSVTVVGLSPFVSKRSFLASSF